MADPPQKPRAAENARVHPSGAAGDGDRDGWRRRLSLTDRPATTSSASLLSLANAFADPAELKLPPAPAPLRIDAPDPIGGADEANGRGRREDRAAEMRARLALGDYTGALDLAEQIVGDGVDDPLDLEARRCAEGCRATLIRMYHARIGSVDRVPVVVVPRERLRWLSLDHRAGFLLSRIDGASTVEDILDVSGMPMLDALRILAELVTKQVIAFR